MHFLLMLLLCVMQSGSLAWDLLYEWQIRRPVTPPHPQHTEQFRAVRDGALTGKAAHTTRENWAHKKNHQIFEDHNYFKKKYML